LKSGAFELPDISFEGVQQAIQSATTTIQDLTPTLEAFEKSTQTRLMIALQLLNNSNVAGKISDAPALQQEAEQLKCVLAQFARSDAVANHKVEAVYNDCVCHIDRLLPLYHRVLGRLVFIAAKVEEQI